MDSGQNSTACACVYTMHRTVYTIDHRRNRARSDPNCLGEFRLCPNLMQHTLDSGPSYRTLWRRRILPSACITPSFGGVSSFGTSGLERICFQAGALIHRAVSIILTVLSDVLYLSIVWFPFVVPYQSYGYQAMRGNAPLGERYLIQIHGTKVPFQDLESDLERLRFRNCSIDYAA